MHTKQEFFDWKDSTHNKWKEVDHTLDLIFNEPIGDYDCLIVGAWGMGVFAPVIDTNSYRHLMATKLVTFANKYQNRYRCIIFAVPGSNNDPNVKIFKTLL